MSEERPRLWLHEAVDLHLRRLPAGPCEVGGWLLGYWTANERDVVVTHATPPGPRGRPWGVTISGRGHRERFDAAWAASAGTVTFIGDWHTHPGGEAIPSDRDRRAMAKLADNAAYGTPRPLIAIVQTPGWPWSRERDETRFYLRGEEATISELVPSVTARLPSIAVRVPSWTWPTRGSVNRRPSRR